MIKLTQNWFTHGQPWASVSKREQCLCGPQKNTRRPQKEPRRPQKEPRRPQKEPRRPQKEPRKLQQSVSKREQCILMSQPIVWFFELLITTYTCCWGFSALLKFTRLDIPRLSRRSTFSGPLGWDLAFWGLWIFRVNVLSFLNKCVYVLRHGTVLAQTHVTGSAFCFFFFAEENEKKTRARNETLSP